MTTPRWESLGCEYVLQREGQAVPCGAPVAWLDKTFNRILCGSHRQRVSVAEKLSEAILFDNSGLEVRPTPAAPAGSYPAA